MSGELCVLIPNRLLGGCETELSEDIIEIIRCLSFAGWCPVDFGEQTDATTELWFEKEERSGSAVTAAKFFIKRGGNV